jgi:poly(A) polymerase
MTIYEAAKNLIKILSQNGHEAYFVGGAVRDHLLGLEINDIDIATSASPEDIANIFPKTIPVGIKFGIIIVVHEGHSFEVATFREDEDYIDGRHPTGIKRSTMDKDVRRRDFTINGLYFDPLHDKLYDLVGGKKDLHDKLIRAIGNPQKRFEEDRLRMIRAARYSACLGFMIEQETKNAIMNMAPLVKEGLSIERIYQELEKMHLKSCLGKGLFQLLELSLLRHLFPQLAGLDHKELDKRIQKISHLSKTCHLILPLMILFDIEDEGSLESLVKFFKTSNTALKIGQLALKMKEHASLSKLKIAELLAVDFHQTLILWQSLSEKHPSEFKEAMLHNKKHLEPVIHALNLKMPIISADDLIALGVPKGPMIKQYMQSAMEDFAAHPQLSKDEIFQRLKKSLDL